MSRSLVEGSGATVVLTWPAVDDSHPDHDLIDLCAEWRRDEEEALHLSGIADKCHQAALDRYPEKPAQLIQKMKKPGDIEARAYLMTEKDIEQATQCRWLDQGDDDVAKAEARRAELLAALSEYQAACKAIDEETGYAAAQEKADTLAKEHKALEKRIRETLAVTADGVMAKLLIPAVIWHPEPPTFDECDSTDERLMVSAALDVSRFASDVTPLVPSTAQHPDAELIALDRERAAAREAFEGPHPTNAAEEAASDRANALDEQVKAMPARTAQGIAIKLRLGLQVQGYEESNEPGWATETFQSCLADLERFSGSHTPGPAAGEHPDDDALFAKLREVEALKAKSRDLGNGPESEAVMDQALDVENELADIPAHTPAGAAAKLGVALHYRAGCNDMTDQLVASAKADLDRQAGTATDVAAAVSALAPPASQLVDDPDFGPVTSEIVKLGREAREHTFKLAKLAILADQYERGGPAEPFIEACAEYAETDRWGAFRIMQLAPGAGSGKRQGGAS